MADYILIVFYFYQKSGELLTFPSKRIAFGAMRRLVSFLASEVSCYCGAYCNEDFSRQHPTFFFFFAHCRLFYFFTTYNSCIRIVNAEVISAIDTAKL